MRTGTSPSNILEANSEPDISQTPVVMEDLKEKAQVNIDVWPLNMILMLLYLKVG